MVVKKKGVLFHVFLMVNLLKAKIHELCVPISIVSTAFCRRFGEWLVVWSCMSTSYSHTRMAGVYQMSRIVFTLCHASVNA